MKLLCLDNLSIEQKLKLTSDLIRTSIALIFVYFEHSPHLPHPS